MASEHELEELVRKAEQARTPAQVKAIVEKIDHLLELRRRQGELLMELRTAVLLEYTGEREAAQELRYRIGAVDPLLARKMELQYDNLIRQAEIAVGLRGK